ncbi:Uncharacterised protein [Serratia quinivorans]|uniref:Uncharacterized protein n=1 Tax=Serratia quinivorans TaxID=137545 RepID=A0A380B5R8_9GAMM|nr:Uncharacterised protein [Serratia quinivorans]
MLITKVNVNIFANVIEITEGKQGALGAPKGSRFVK